MRKIANDETFSTVATVIPNSKKLEMAFAVKPSEKSPDRFEIKSTVDFSKCSDADVLLLAAQSVRITMQRMFRVAYLGSNKSEALADATWQKFDVKSRIIDVERTRGTVDPVSAVSRNLAKMSTADARKLLLAEIARLDGAAKNGNGKK